MPSVTKKNDDYNSNLWEEYQRRLGRETADTCLQFHGGMGYVEEYPIARYFRDVRLLSIGGGADEVMLEVIAKLAGISPKA